MLQQQFLTVSTTVSKKFLRKGLNAHRVLPTRKPKTFSKSSHEEDHDFHVTNVVEQNIISRKLLFFFFNDEIFSLSGKKNVN